MDVQRFNFRELDGTPVGGKKPANPFVPTGRAKVETPPPPPSFSEGQMKVAERDSYRKGFLEGTQEGRKQAESDQAAVDRALTETVEKFARSIMPLFTDYRQMALQLKEHMPKTALAIARKVASTALDENAPAVIEDVVLRACDTLSGEPRIAITVHESLADTLTRKLEQLAHGMPAVTSIVVQRDPAMPQADCRIEWKHGAIERDTGKLWGQVEKVIADMTAVGRRDTEAHLETLQAQLPPEEKG